MVFCVREIEALRLLGWCQYIRPAQLLRVVSETELSNLLAMKLIKYHTEKRESLLLAQNEKKRQLAQLESDWELLCAEEETAKKEERQTSVLSPYHEISVLDPILMRELVCEVLVFSGQKIQINWKFRDFTSEFAEQSS